MNSVQQEANDLADVLHSQIRRAADGDGSIRGADWRLATVASIQATGTVTTTDGVVARRTDLYVTPVVGDTIILTVSGMGNWLALGRVAPVTTAGTWQALTYNGTWSAWGAPHYSPAYRINGDGTVSLSGLAKAPGSTTGTSTIATLPTAARPAQKARFSTIVNPGVNGALDVNTDGTIQITDYSGTAIWATLDGATFRLT
ncbi:hypothetical protein ADK53_28890 [Streptomyces sp. WM6373]|uniref:hypothetical protein n=1 Tax=Streptomyces sp. WM6373 TaxID=1415556 RepID=UPI0006AE1C58|nr:hypothetical protein [Streptomyces sp. WM6373]KOU30229.1 hypothetical protein ADK53_28890 [Streptomyces sp. WM6373]